MVRGLWLPLEDAATVNKINNHHLIEVYVAVMGANTKWNVDSYVYTVVVSIYMVIRNELPVAGRIYARFFFQYPHALITYYLAVLL